jgi:hypothetical protein
MLTTIHITVRDRVPTITAGEDVISHNSDYVAEFEFDEEWQDKVKTVYFVCEDGSYQAVVMSGNSCGVPMLDGEHRRIFVGVQAGSIEKPSVLKTTCPCCLKVRDSIADLLGQPIPDPTPDVYEQIIAMLNNLTAPTWDSVQNKPFSTLGSGLEVDENGVLSAQGGSGGSANAVQYVEQTLTDEQKAQARSNIDADKKRIVVEARRSSGGSTMVYYNVDDQNAAIDKFIAEYKAGTEILLRLYNRDYPLTNIDEDGIVYFSGYIYDAANKSVGVIVYKMEKNKAVVEESSLYGIKAISLDNQLKYKGYAADAKAVGDALQNYVPAENYEENLQEIAQALGTKLDKNQGTANAGKILGIGEDGIVVPQDKPTYTLPQATADALGGIKADAATAEDTQVVRIGTDGKLRTKPTGGSSITVDDALSSTSENPVQNKVVTAALAEKITAPTSAEVGQIIKVKSVDTSGKPTEWEAVTAKLANPNALTFTGAVTGSYDGSESLTVEIPSGGGSSGGSGKAKSQILINQEITELTASLSVTLEHDFHNLTAIIHCGLAGVALTADSDGNAVASNIALLIDTTDFGFNARKVALTDTSIATWQTRMIGAEWSDDLSVFKRGFKVDIAVNAFKAYYTSLFGGSTAMYGTLMSGDFDNAPRTGKTANIIVKGAYLNVGTKVVLWGEYYE